MDSPGAFFECKRSRFIGEEGRTTTANVNTHEFRDGDEGGGKEQNALLKQQSEEIKERMKEQGMLLHVRHGNQVVHYSWSPSHGRLCTCRTVTAE